MGLIESIKATGIRTADFLNKLKGDPFEDFTRQAIPRDPLLKLKDLEQEFYSDLVNNFWVCDGQVLASRLPLPPGSPIDMGDQAIWHGVYTATLALRHHLSEDSDVQNETFGHLVQAAKGLQLHQQAHGEAKPRLIRGVSDDLKTWQDDASNDSASGHLLGIYFGWKFGPETMRPVFEQLAGGLAAEIANHGHALVRADGKPTTYGALEQGWRTDPLRITLALAIYAVAATLTREPTFINLYEALFRKYRALISYPKVKLWWIDNANDTHRAAIHLAILSDLTQGDARQDYVYGLERLRRMCAKHANVWVNALCAWGGYAWSPDNAAQARKVLSEFSLKQKMFNDGKDNAHYSDKRLGEYRYIIKKVLWNGKWMASTPVPRWAARSQDFFWQRNLFSLDEGSEGQQPDSRLNGGDFLAAYWLSVLTGSVTRNQ